MGESRADEKASLPPRTTKTYAHRWPRWWDDIERPDVPVSEVLLVTWRRAQRARDPARCRADCSQGADGVGGSCAHADISEQS